MNLGVLSFAKLVRNWAYSFPAGPQSGTFKFPSKDVIHSKDSSIDEARSSPVFSKFTANSGLEAT